MLEGANATGASFRGATLTNVTLDGTDISGAILTGVKSGGVVSLPVSYLVGQLVVGGYILAPGVDLTGAAPTMPSRHPQLAGESVDGVALRNQTPKWTSHNARPMTSTT